MPMQPSIWLSKHEVMGLNPSKGHWWC